MPIYVGLSGGHHESTAVAYDSDLGSRSNRVKARPINPHNQEQCELVTRIEELFLALLDVLNCDSLMELEHRCGGLVLALPGAGTPADWLFGQELLATFLGHNDPNRYRVVDDTWAGLYAETLEAKGVCAFAGTGASVCVALGSFAPDKRHKIDGWGPVIGDFGSAFQLVTDFFRRLGRYLDRNPRDAPPLFEQMRLAHPGIPPVDQVQHWFDDMFLREKLEWRVKFALLADVITRAADDSANPDSLERQLVRSCALDMADSIQIALARFAPESDSLPIVFQGGMFRRSSAYLGDVRQALGEIVASRTRLAILEPVYGALFLACGEDRELLQQVAACCNKHLL